MINCLHFIDIPVYGKGGAGATLIPTTNPEAH